MSQHRAVDGATGKQDVGRGTGSEGQAGLAPGGPHILAASGDCNIFAPEYLSINVPSQPEMTDRQPLHNA